MSIELTDCGPGDYDAVAQIYNHYVRTSHATFDVLPFSVVERIPWFTQFADNGAYRLLLARLDGVVAGYACSTPFKSRPAYQQSIETTVYVAADALGQGIGKKLYETLFRQLGDCGLHRAYASIALPNDASVRLHEAFGFRQVGICHEVGFKFDSYWDVAIFEKCL